MMLRVLSSYLTYASNRAISHIFLSLCRPEVEVPVQFTCLVSSCDPNVERSNVVKAIPNLIRPFVFRLRANDAMTEWRYLQALKHFDAAYLWPGFSLATIRKVKSKGKPIFIERINCFTGFTKSVMNSEYIRLGLGPRHPTTDQTVQDELEETKLADFIFCPSPHVRSSFLDAGVPAEKLLLSSYGWCPSRFPDLLHQSPAPKAVDRPFTILFVGTVCVRKGAHLLMDAYVRSGIKGKLILCGEMEPAIAEVCQDWLRRPDIIHQPYVNNISTFYQDADLFAFPSLEEGSPLVSYEAMAHGLPMLVSPMGGGEIVRDGVDGFIRSEFDRDAWVEIIQKLAASPDLRHQLGRNASQRAAEFTYEKVANQRARMILEHLTDSATSPSV
ncbi:glycosyltransferase family 4 protein [Leptolyngbya sp. FACHB-321]|nr:glycosyltransferase family 4 protein [Leptolyngbya sp. FACHB-321]